ncbi:protein-L-isoaspartate(D-aspartate) O-methyltransferase [Desulfobacca acetoxidans]
MIFFVLVLAGQGAAADSFAEARARMVEKDLKGRDIIDVRVLAAMAQTPRHLFVPQHLQRWAYNDHPLPIGHGATISQPYIVALMTQAAAVQSGQRVLEVGTGSGYQAAVLATLTDQVYTIEISPELARSAADRLQKLGYHQVQVKCGDGYQGWPEAAPFDAIIVTAATREIPPVLKAQLKDGGRLIIPLGSLFGPQYLLRLTRDGHNFREEMLCPVAFVPLIKPEK